MSQAKSIVFFSKKFSNQQRTTLANNLNLKQPGQKANYLGLPLKSGISESIAFEDVIIKAKSKLQRWKSKTLSNAGKTTFRYVASAIPSYIMSFVLPKKTFSKLDAMFRDFWWGSSSSSTKLCYLRAWDGICLPKSVRGIGLCRIHD